MNSSLNNPEVPQIVPNQLDNAANSEQSSVPRPHQELGLGAERQVSSLGQVSQGPPAVVGMALPAVAAPPMPLASPAIGSQMPRSISASNPPIADDVDVIEKEWVDKAKKIVNETKNDPYKQEEEVQLLQADYLKKRYGKEIKIRSSSVN